MDKKSSLYPLKKYSFKVALAPILKLVECCIELATPLFIRFIIDEGVAKNDLSYVLKMGGLILGLTLIGFLITLVAQYLSARVSSNYGYDLRKEVFAQANRISLAEEEKFGKDKTLTLLNNDAFSMQNGVNMFMRLFLRPPFLTIGSIIISFIIDYRAGLVFLGVVALSSLVLGLVIKVSPKKYAAIQASLDEISTLGSDSLRGARPIRAFEQGNYEEKKFDTSIENYRKKSLSMAKWNALINPFSFCFINLGMVLVVYLGGLGVSNGYLTSGQIVCLISYLTLSLSALLMFSRFIVSINRASASKKRLDAFLKIEPSIVNKAKYHVSDAVEGAPLVKFNDVSFSYGGTAKDAVSHLDFALTKGHSLGIIGGTGSGKSTTISLLERLYEPTGGEILYRGLPLNDYDLPSLHQEISLVSQKPAIFKGTIRSNLLLGNPKASEEEMVQALKDSLAYEFVSRYSDFLEHPVEENGVNFSGGQKQRLLIARALLAPASLLILDDSMSALDFLSDRTLRENLAKRTSQSLILISQRATSLSLCDEILVYDKGKIVGRGQHEELLKSCPIYASIYAMQVANQ